MPTNRATLLLIPGHRRHIRHGGKDVIQIVEAASAGAFLDAVADLPDGDLGGEGDGDDGVHTGALALSDIDGLTDEEVGDVGLDDHGRWIDGLMLAGGQERGNRGAFPENSCFKPLLSGAILS